MKLVDARGFSSLDAAYAGIPQPMVIYHSIEELKIDNKERVVVVSDWKKLHKKLQEYSLNKTLHRYNSLSDVSFFGDKIKLFLATNEYYEMNTVTNEGVRVVNEDHKVENNYIQVFGWMKRYGDIIEIVTSSGIWKVSIIQGSLITAGIAPRLRSESQWNRKMAKEMKDKKKAKLETKLTKGRTPVMQDYQFTQFLLHPNSPTYLNLFGSARMGYGKDVDNQTLSKILESTRIKNLITKQIGIFMPQLSEAIKIGLPANELAGLLIKVAKDTVENREESVENKLKAVQAVMNSGYSEEGLVLDYGAEGSAAIGNAIPQQNLIGGSEPKALGAKFNGDATFDKILEDVGGDETYIMDEDSERPTV